MKLSKANLLIKKENEKVEQWELSSSSFVSQKINGRRLAELSKKGPT